MSNFGKSKNDRFLTKAFLFFLGSIIFTGIITFFIPILSKDVEAANVLTNPSFTGGATGWSLTSLTYDSSTYQDSAGSLTDQTAVGRNNQTSGTATQTISSTINGGSSVNLSLYWNKQCVAVDCTINTISIDVTISGSTSTIWSNTTIPTAGSATGWQAVTNLDVSSYFTTTGTYDVTINMNVRNGNNKSAQALAWLDNINLDVTAPVYTITVGSTGTQTSTVQASTSDFYIGGAFTFVREASSANVTSITVSEMGTISDSNISGLILYYKQEASCSTSIPGDATQFNSTPGTFSSGSSTVTGTMAVSTSQICMYVEADIGSGAGVGDTIEIQITDPSTQVSVSDGTVSPATAVAISGTTTIAANQAPNFTVFTDNGPKDPGTDITFSTTASDPDGNNIQLIVCKTQGVTGTACDGGAGDTWCSSSLTTSNPSCVYSIPIPSNNYPDYDAYPYIFDEAGLGSSSGLQGTLDTFTVNNVNPVVSNVTINGGSAIDLTAGTTKAVTITGTVTDNNGCPSIYEVLASTYRSGIGGTGGTYTYYFDASVSGPTDISSVWGSDSNAFDGLTTSDATTADYIIVTPPSTNYLGAIGTNAPSSGGVITQVRARIYAASTWSLYLTLGTPSGGWDWNKVQNLDVRLYTIYDLISTYSAGFTIYYDGSNLGSYYITDIGGSPWRFSRAEIEVTSSAEAYLSCDEPIEANDNYCYTNITCTVDTGTCTGSSDPSADYTCTANLEYFADPTDTNTQYPTEYWMSTISALDVDDLSDYQEVSAGVKLNSLAAFNVTNTVNFGSLDINQKNDPLDRTTTVTPTGNVGLDTELSGPPNMCTDFPTCSGSTIGIANQKYALSASTAYTSATSLTTSVVEAETNIAKPISTTPTAKSIWWGMLIPEGTNPGSYDGTITITGVKGETAEWGNWYDTDWTYRVKVTTASSEISSDLENFPIYLDLSLLPIGFHTNVNQTDARDIRITTSDGVTEIPREIVFYDSSTDTGELHFKGDLSSSLNTDFYIYYGNAAASDYIETATYGRNNVWSGQYAGVWHLQENVNTDTDGYLDSTGNGNDGTGVNMDTTEGDGQIGQGQNFTGIDNEHIIVSGNGGSTGRSLSIWLKTTSNSSNLVPFGESNTASSPLFILQGLGTGFRTYLRDDSGNYVDVNDGSTEYRDGFFHQFVTTSDGSSLNLYKDGSPQGTPASLSTIGTTTLTIRTLGLLKRSTLDYPFTGMIDEARVATSALPSYWISTEYNNQSSPNTFFQIGVQEAN